MKYFVIFLVLAGFAGFVPPALGSCISLPCDDANIQLGEPNYRFLNFTYANINGDPILFVLERTALDDCTSFQAEITDESGNIVWEEGSFALCDPITNPSLITSEIRIGYNENNPIMLDEFGYYVLKVQIDDGNIEKEFMVRPKPTGVSLDRTKYPVQFTVPLPLQQFKSGVPLDEIQCKEGLMLVKMHDDRPACIKSSSFIELHFRKVVDCVWNCTIPIPQNHIEKDKPDDTTMTIDGKSFYYYVVNETMNSAQGEGKKINFHDVAFTLFPRPKDLNLGGFCGSGSFGTSILFSDGIHESLEINIPEVECMDKFSQSDLLKLTNYTSPQAGLMFSDGDLRLLVARG